MKTALSWFGSQPSLAACVGMLAGAALDAGHAGFLLLADLCASAGAISFVETLRLHWICLPNMHAGLMLGAMISPCCIALSIRNTAALIFQFFWALACATWMLLTMNLGSYLWVRAGLPATEVNTIAVMLFAMVAGMQAWRWIAQLPRVVSPGLRPRLNAPMRT